LHPFTHLVKTMRTLKCSERPMEFNPCETLCTRRAANLPRYFGDSISCRLFPGDPFPRSSAELSDKVIEALDEGEPGTSGNRPVDAAALRINNNGFDDVGPLFRSISAIVRQPANAIKWLDLSFNNVSVVRRAGARRTWRSVRWGMYCHRFPLLSLQLGTSQYQPLVVIVTA